MLSITVDRNRAPSVSSTLHPVASASIDQGATGPYFGILPTEVIGRIFFRLPIESRAHSTIASRVCTRFAEASALHRLAAEVYAGADLQQGRLSTTECIARVEKTLAGLARHACNIDDRHKVAILNRLVNQMDSVEVDEQVKVWCQLLDARTSLAKADRPDYVLKCLREAVLLTVLCQPLELLDCFKALISVIADAPTDTAAALFSQSSQMLSFMPAYVQQQAFAGLLAVCQKPDGSLHLSVLEETIEKISWLKESIRAEAADAILQLLPRLHHDQVAPVLKSLLGDSSGLSNQHKTVCMDTGILLFNRMSGNSKRAVLHEMFRFTRMLPWEMNEKYFPTLMACRLSLPAHQQGLFAWQRNVCKEKSIRDTAVFQLLNSPTPAASTRRCLALLPGRPSAASRTHAIPPCNPANAAGRAIARRGGWG